MIIGLVSAAVISVLTLAVAFWCRQKRAKSKSQSDSATDERQSTNATRVESMEPFSPSSNPHPSNAILNNDKNAPDSTPVDGFLVASNSKLLPEKAQLFDNLDGLSHQDPPQRKAANSSVLNGVTLASNFKPLPEKVSVIDLLGDLDDRKFETVSSLKAALPSGSTLAVSPGSMSITAKSKIAAPQTVAHHHEMTTADSLVEFASISENAGSSSHRMALPDNPRDWNQDETAQWILERFGDATLSSLALSQNINGRALLMLDRQDMKADLGLETVGRRLIFEEAVAELRRQSAQQSALAQESPPSYE
ncbi:hypothetical protein BJ741DRAFT_635374 [Chytriomyces cf. hyalinus JEL632]|nr:hypothetical protein BJ741DRAFT_635374 [Chytriomyces cf. hyalinus JEL632]